CRYRRAQLARWFDAPRIEIGRHAREGHVDVRARGVDVARWVARFGRSYLRRHERRCRIVGRWWLEVRQAPIRIAQMADDALATGVDRQRRRHDEARADTASQRLLPLGPQT